MVFLSLVDDPDEQSIFTSLYYEYRWQMLHTAFSILHDEGLAEDAVQNAFLRVAKSMKRLDFSRDARALLLTITINCAKTILIKESRERTVFCDTDIETIADSMDVEELHEIKARIERISQVIAKLPEEYSVIFSLRFRHNMKSKEIADIVGLSDDVVRKRIQRLKKIVKEVDQDE